MDKVDRRIIKSQNAIHSAFLAMLIEDGFDNITVKTITERADISRKTFYLHYVDKYDLLDKIVAEHLSHLHDVCESKRDKGLIEGTVIWFLYFEQHKAFFAALFRSKGTVSFRQKLLQFILGEVEKKLDADERLQGTMDKQIIKRFLGSAVMGVLESYILDEIDGDIEAVAMQVGQLMKKHL